MLNNNLKFNKQFFQDLWRLLKPYWSSEEKWIAVGLFSLYVLCILGEIGSHVGFNSFHKSFFNALQAFNKPAIVISLWKYVCVVVLYVLSVGGCFYFRGLLSIRWRRWLTKNYLNKWLNNHMHYRLHVLNQNVDNPDQRISEDLDKFPEATIKLFREIFYSVLMLISFGYILWNLSGSISIPIGSKHIVIPGLFCWIAFLYAIFGTWITVLIGKALAFLDYKQQQYNADFRFGLARLRETSEQVASYRGESCENKQFHGLFSRIFGNYINIVFLKTCLMFFSKSHGFLAYVIGLAISMPLYLAKTILLGVVMQISSAFNSVNSAFSVFIESFNEFADWRSVIYRLTEFEQSMDKLHEKNPSAIIINEHGGDDIVVTNLSLALPDGQVLLQEINLVLLSGKATLLTGESGVGKTTFLRVLAGLWPYGKGIINFPQHSKKIFLPQKPYFPLGSLKNALLYPYNNDIEESELHQVLEMCDLKDLQNQLNTDKNWPQELSLGEQQLVAFARLFIHKPDIIFLDEATSALDEETEFKIYKKLREHLPCSTIVSVGHRSSLHQFHEKLIVFSKSTSFSGSMKALPAL